jgi:hypothetical protein
VNETGILTLSNENCELVNDISLDFHKNRIISAPSSPIESKKRKTIDEISISTIHNPVIVTTNLDKTQTKKMTKIAKKLNATIVTKYDDTVTHVVTEVNENNIARRTLKYSTGIVSGAFVVGFQWITDSFDREHWLDELEYEVSGDHVAKHAPENTRKYKLKIFKDVRFFLFGSFEMPNPAIGELTYLIQKGGGEIITEIEDFVVGKDVAIADKSRMKDELATLKKKYGIEPISFNWLLDSVSHSRLVNKTDYLV